MYILDSIMSYNTSVNSQFIPPDYIHHVPKVSKQIKNEGSRGDFIASFSRQFDSQLARRFQHHWKMNDEKFGEEFKLRNFELKYLSPESRNDENILIEYANFLRSDHVRFWYGNHQMYNTSLKSILITDTGTYLMSVFVKIFLFYCTWEVFLTNIKCISNIQ